MGRGQQAAIMAMIFIVVIAVCYWLAAGQGTNVGQGYQGGGINRWSSAVQTALPIDGQGRETAGGVSGTVEGASASLPAPLVTPGQPVPLVANGKPVDWWFVFKFNSASFPGCDGAYVCPFGGTRQRYRSFSQQYVMASSASPTLVQGGGCIGTTTSDPVGATFDEVYNGHYNYVVWNDQFYDDPVIAHCKQDCGAPWGHSKGMVAWNDAGEGMVMQVSTPSWPGAGSAQSPRQSDGNTLGCVKDNDVLVSQHFFATRLTHDDLLKVLRALGNASVVTDVNNPQIVQSGGPVDVQALVAGLGRQVKSRTVDVERLSDGIELIAKPSALHVPPWQLVSAELGGIGLRVASWWAKPEIPSTAAAGVPGSCWDASLGTPGPVAIATSGQWHGVTLGLTGGEGTDRNHAKIGVSMDAGHPRTVFGDMNQQGKLDGNDCDSSQNGRGGLFFVVENAALAGSVGQLIEGGTAATQ